MYSAYKIWSSKKRFEPTSPGEVLWYALRDWFFKGGSDGTKALDISWADPKGRLTQFLDNTVISTVCVRMIDEARRCLADSIGQISDPQIEVFRYPVVDRMKQFCVDPLGMSFSDSTISIFSDHAFECAKIARRTISDHSRTMTFREAARVGAGSITCYSCGASLGSWNVVRQTRDVALDHLWPRSFGGLSDETNLLPICNFCNGLKMDRISWDVFGVTQDYSLSKNSTAGLALTKMALHRRAAVQVAETQRITLKESFMRLGPSKPIDLIHPDGGDWFFNQSAHDLKILPELW